MGRQAGGSSSTLLYCFPDICLVGTSHHLEELGSHSHPPSGSCRGRRPHYTTSWALFLDCLHLQPSSPSVHPGRLPSSLSTHYSTQEPLRPSYT